jgi:hypothetical protein
MAADTKQQDQVTIPSSNGKGICDDDEYEQTGQGWF